MIKFRAWDNLLNKMLVVYRINFDGPVDGVQVHCYLDDRGAEGSTEYAYDGDGLILEQFTGLTDVNGQDIYEGDIIQYSHQFYEYSMGGVTDRETGYIGTVVKKNGAFGIFINKISYTDAHNDCYHAKDFVPFCDFDDPESDMLLKGNVHANPELLEADK